MALGKGFGWIGFYQELADKLLLFVDDRKLLIDHIKNTFLNIGIKLPTLDKDGDVHDVDPFTVFGLFNKGITNENRIKITSGLAKEFGIKADVPKTYAGIPVMNNQQATFYAFDGNRQENDIVNLWKMFVSALNYADKQTEENRQEFIKIYDMVITQKCVKWNLTMGLYWVRPEVFINLDSRNRVYLAQNAKAQIFADKLPHSFTGNNTDVLLSGEEYIKFCDDCREIISNGNADVNSFPELSDVAWQASMEKTGVRYWLYSPGKNAVKWEEFYNKGIMAIDWQDMGDLSFYPDRDAMHQKMLQLYPKVSDPTNDSLATWEFFHEIKPGDVIYAKKGTGELKGRGIVKSDYRFDEDADSFGHIREVEWTHHGKWKNEVKRVQKSLTEITKEEEYTKMEALFGLKPGSGEIEEPLPKDKWWPTVEEYTPGFTKEDWLSILKNPDIIGPVWGGVLAAFYGMGGAATCTQVGKKYSRSPSGISGICTNLARSIYKLTNCPIGERENGQKRYWTILFQGKDAGPDVEGAFIWKLRPELYDALTDFDIMRYEWGKDIPVVPAQEIGFWWLNANPKIWSFSKMAVGEKVSYTLYNDNGHKRRIFQNFLDAKAGDYVIGYESTPVKQIVALAKVSASHDGKEIWFEKTESISTPVDYSVLKECPELKDMEFFQNQQASLLKLTKDEYDYILDLIREDNPVQKEGSVDKYTQEEFLKDVYMSEGNYLKMKGVLLNKQNIILQGAPGVGKTYSATRLAYSIIGEKNDDYIEFVQFHQNYSYEDFVMGYKPAENGFSLRQGVFYRFCKKAESQPDNKFFFIIDEINRGNMSKIFGELLMLIEKDYRGESATLAYNGLPFTVPKNLYIIGMMNTADRSLAMIDYALRRRFSFFDMEPGFDTDQFAAYQAGLNNKRLDNLISQVKLLNQEITADKSLGKGFCIGHSYFCGQEVCTDDWLYSIVNYDILPMLREYWFDDAARVQKWEDILLGVLQ